MLQHREAVIRLRRPAIFGGQPVIDGNEFRTDKIGDLRADGVMALQRTDDETAAMKIEQNGPGVDFARPVAPDRDALDHAVRKDHIRGQRAVEARAQSIAPMPTEKGILQFLEICDSFYPADAVEASVEQQRHWYAPGLTTADVAYYREILQAPASNEIAEPRPRSCGGRAARHAPSAAPPETRPRPLPRCVHLRLPGCRRPSSPSRISIRSETMAGTMPPGLQRRKRRGNRRLRTDGR